jgi:hypothetical protein
MINPLSQLRHENHEHLHRIWKRAQTGNVEELSDEEKLLASIMLEHEEYHNQFEILDLLHDHQYDVQSEVNPLLHVIFHAVIENQLAAREPMEVYQFYNAMRQNKVSRHEAIHCIGTIFSYLIQGVLTGTGSFDDEKYRSLLKKLKNRKPDKIVAAMESEFG